MDDVSSETYLKMNLKSIAWLIKAISYFVLLRSLNNNNIIIIIIIIIVIILIVIIIIIIII